MSMINGMSKAEIELRLERNKAALKIETDEPKIRYLKILIQMCIYDLNILEGKMSSAELELQLKNIHASIFTHHLKENKK